MRVDARLVPAFLAFFGAAALAAEKTYDDRVIIERGLEAARKLLGAIPAPKSVNTDPRAFNKGEILRHVRELKAVERSVALALRRQASAAEINPHRREVRDALARSFREFDAYKKVYAAVAALVNQRRALKSVKPPKCPS